MAWSHELPAVSIETRRMKAFAKASSVKTDRKGILTHLIAPVLKVGLYRAAHVKTDDSQRLRCLLRTRVWLPGRMRDVYGRPSGTSERPGNSR
jgi:transposase